MVVIMQNTHEKANLLKMKVNAIKITKVRADENKLRAGKEWRPCIGPVVQAVGRLLWSVSETKIRAVFENFKIRQL